MLLTTFPTLYVTSPWLLCNSQSVLLSPFTFSLNRPTPPPPPSNPLGPYMLLQRVRLCVFFLWPRNTPLYIGTTAFLSTCLLTGRHLGSFHVLVLVNNVAMNIEVNLFFWIAVNSLVHKAVPFLFFEAHLEYSLVEANNAIENLPLRQLNSVLHKSHHHHHQRVDPTGVNSRNSLLFKWATSRGLWSLAAWQHYPVWH